MLGNKDVMAIYNNWLAHPRSAIDLITEGEAAAITAVVPVVQQLTDALQRATKHEDADFEALQAGRAWLTESQGVAHG